MPTILSVRRFLTGAAFVVGAALLVAAAVNFRDHGADERRTTVGHAGGTAITVAGVTHDASVGRALLADVHRARAGDYRALWRALSTATRRRFTYATFRSRVGPDLRDEIGSLKPGGLKIIVSHRAGRDLGIASVAGTRVDRDTGLEEFETYAYGLVREEQSWKLELLTEVALELLSPDQTIPASRPQIALNVVARSPVTSLAMWIDGRPIPITAEGAEPTDLRVFAEAGTRGSEVGPGDHTIVLFVSVASVAGTTPVAHAWTFIGG